MQTFLEYLNKNQWLNLVFLILAVLSILISIITYYRSKKEKVPVYHQKSFNLIENRLNKITAVKITYNDQEVRNLTLTKLSLWNKGREMIERDDIAPSDPLRIEVATEYQILQSDINYVRTKANNFSIRLSDDKKRLFIDFDYFYTNEGVVIELYHTGLSGDDIKLIGTIKGVRGIKPGIIENDTFADMVFLSLASPFRRLAGRRTGDLLFSILFFVMIPLTFPLFSFLLFLGTVVSIFTEPPREFSLEEKD